MTPPANVAGEGKHDAFISYSRRDKAFAEKLQKALGRFAPPKDLGLERRNLDVFRDETDFTGVDYHESVDRHLRSSSKLILICSPDARASDYVNDEVRRFSSANGADNIIAVLFRGKPNNETEPGKEADMAFPQALCDVLEMPLAANYLDFDPRKDKCDKGGFGSSWYSLLANLYGVSRAHIEERDKKRQQRRRRILAGLVASIVVALTAALVVTLISRRQAVEQLRLAQARQLATQADLVATETPQTVDHVELRTLLAIESLRRSDDFEDRRVIATATDLLPSRTIALPYDESRSHYRPLAFSPDGRRIALGHSDKAQVLDTTTGRVLAEFDQLGDADALAFNRDGSLLAAGFFKSGVEIVDTVAHVTIRQIPYENRAVVRLAMDRAGAIVAVGSVALGTMDPDYMVDLRETRTGELRWRVQEDRRDFALEFSDDWTRLATGSGATGRLLDVATGEVVTPLEDISTAIAFHPSGRLLASGGHSGVVSLYKLPRGKKGMDIALPAVSDLVSAMDRIGKPAIAFDQEGFRLAVAGGAGIIRVFEMGGAMGMKQIARWDGRESVSAIVFSHDRLELLAVDRFNRLQAFAFDPQAPYLEAVALSETPFISLTADGRFAAGGGFDWTAKVYETDSGREIFEAGKVDIESVVASGDGRFVAFLGRYDDKEIRVLEVADDSNAKVVTVESDVERLALSYEGLRLGAALETGRVEVFNIGEEGEPWSTDATGVSTLAFGLNGNVLAIAHAEGVSIFDLSGVKNVIRLGSLSDVTTLAISRNGRYVAAGCGDGKLRIADLKSKELIRELSQPGVMSVAFSRDGTNLAAGGTDRTTRIYDSKTGQELARLHSEFEVHGVSFSGDGKHVVTAGGPNLRTRVWMANDLIEEACSRLTRNLSQDEWQQYLFGEPYRETCRDRQAFAMCKGGQRACIRPL